MEDVHPSLFVPVDDPTGWLNDLPVPPAFELRELGTASWMLSELPNVPDDALDEVTCRDGIVQGDVVGYRLEVAQSGLCPDYFSHRDRRRLAWACVTVRPSSSAFSPRAMPSSNFIRCCSDS